MLYSIFLNLFNRIERYWRDVFYGYTGALYNVFQSLEEDGELDVDNPKHLLVLHKVFIPRINQHLETFRHAWNKHPLSSERNYTPEQLMFMSLPAAEDDLNIAQVTNNQYEIKIVKWEKKNGAILILVFNLQGGHGRRKFHL